MANTLPPELLTKVFENISSCDNQRSTVHSCLLVNKELYYAALRLLYKDLVFFIGPQLDLFIACHDRWAISSLTRSLTLYINCPPEITGGFDCDTHDPFLQLAAAVIPRMSNLGSFSLARHYRDSFSSIQTQIVPALLRSIPPKCTSLELALGTSDNVNFDLDGPKPHLCEDLRRLLPRMQHAHVDMSCLCDAMFGTWGSDNCFHPIALPNIQRLHVPCVGAQLKSACSERHQQDQWSIWKSIIRALQLVVELPDTADADITVLDSVAPLSSYKLHIYTTLLRCQIRKGRTTTWAFPTTPYVVEGATQGRYWKLRLVYIRLNGETYMTDKKWIYALAAGRPWRISKTDARLPASCNVDWVADEKLKIKTWKEWEKAKIGEGPMLLKNEELAGMRLIDAEEREGYEEVCLVEKTPPGFTRPSRYHRGQIFREKEE
ncbi:uncharacterized protein FFB20_02644 [Fusarium fujikuroi]|uniref:F-box domain-containing protein n=2 Tax=Fusarium fujikuroi TaxID=5127 RepID=S0E6Q0_GIBF5|nr:uncharacterized protein FFUJ_06513 [Fusarium fujikuroi IMI 58289]SCN67536.1 uncharacterized protein FFB20_02644 [Fusarium fujikuroi]CCT70534.1 uncharacterized protein FFUJ_06513 [Fusarium fujikuroi IMI 58289]SCN83660.1 uncharacterized protein FFM5_03084 [Fusarium fujikuroi]SCN86082.1 uncharacterized protein FFC1_05050 [Fusarium fujikuroi]SCO23645.1 uncharacterized protein FFE2_15709 [Fusarium fujikuroi]